MMPFVNRPSAAGLVLWEKMEKHEPYGLWLMYQIRRGNEQKAKALTT
jgi:hypothetical protein